MKVIRGIIGKLNFKSINVLIIIVGLILIASSFYNNFLTSINLKSPILVLFSFISQIYISIIGFILISSGIQLMIINYFLTREHIERALIKLNRNEKIVLEILEDYEGEIEQSRLVEISGFSPSKVSRIIGNLEKMGIVECRREGKAKVISLTRQYLLADERL